MPVTRYRSVSDMPRPPRIVSHNLGAELRAVWNRTFLLSLPEVVPGVLRFRTIEQANDARTASTLRQMRRSAR
jgi:hypothetical protein